MHVPCGSCVGCRLERARQWALRCMHESSLHDVNSFVTLTYSNEHLEPGASLRPRDFTLFMKRLRKKRGDVRYFQCGEYGSKSGRPHHHALLFGVGFSDRVRCRSSGSGEMLYRSPELEGLWPYGDSYIGEVTFKSAGYIARYGLKKSDGVAAGVVGPRFKSYLTMSRRPGIGAGWLDKYGSEVYAFDEVVVNGKVCKPPRFYDERYARENPGVMEEVRTARRGAADGDPDSTGKRLITREAVKTAAISFLERSL